MSRTALAASTLGAAVLLVAAAPGPSGGDAKRGAGLFADQCSLCHGGDGGQGPNLHGVTGRRAGIVPGFGYSAALKKSGVVWDDAHLDRYLTNPQALVPGSIMPARVDDAGQRRDLIAYLHTLAASPSKPAPVHAAAPAPPPPAAPPKKMADTVVFGDWRLDAPGVRHRVTPADLPAPFATASAGNGPQSAPRPPGRLPVAPDGVRVTAFAEGLDGPRLLRTAPNGDVFVAESGAGRVKVLRAPDGADRASSIALFAQRLRGVFGLAFYPAGPDPRWLYAAETNRIVRYPYRSGDLKARGPAEVVVAKLAASTGGHSTRDIAFSPDGRRMYVSVGSGSNVAEGMAKKSPADAQAYGRDHGAGATWGNEADRADVLAFTPEGRERRVYAAGIRNCVGLAVHPERGAVWCSTNERDGLGDNLVPDYVTSVKEGAFYGWPWWYLGDHEEPRLKGERPDLKGHITVPDVLLQPHSAALQLAFYDGRMFPQWRGHLLVAAHGSWNRALRTGYKLIDVPVGPDGRAMGGYVDVLTGFVLDPGHVWGRPVGVAEARDGAILVSDDGSDTVWRLARPDSQVAGGPPRRSRQTAGSTPQLSTK